MTRRDDDQLLERLSAALAPPAAAPSAAEVEALHRMVAGHDDAVATIAPRPGRGLGWRLGLVAAAAMVLLIAVVANRSGTSADSADLARARTSLQELRGAIDQGDRAAVADALSEAERRVAVLEPAERQELEPQLTTLEQQARALLADPSTTTAAPPGSSTTTTVVPATTVAPPPQTATTIDDKGGQRDRSGSNSGKG